jgi:hypothetical protein
VHSQWKRYNTFSFCLGWVEYTPEFAVLHHQCWQDVFLLPCFWHSPKGSSQVLKDQVSRLARWWQWNKKGVCLKTLSWDLAWKFVLFKQVLQTSLCMTAVSITVPFNKQAGFQISNAVTFWHMWPAGLPVLVVLDYFLCGYIKSKLYEMCPTSIGDLKLQILECMQGIHEKKQENAVTYSWFQTFAVFWMLYAFFWVIPRHLNFICQRFGILTPTCLWRWNGQSVQKRRHIKFRRQGITQKKAYNMLWRPFLCDHGIVPSYTVVTYSALYSNSND